MAQWKNIAIVGVGLIGGSIGLALKKRGLAERIIGIGRRQSSLQAALDCGAVTTTTTDLDLGVSQAELIVVCTPVSQIVRITRNIATACHGQALITDVGSTKAGIVSAIGTELDRGVTFVGSHPMAGSEKTGPDAARHDLFEGRITVVTPVPDTPRTATNRITEFWEELGGTVLEMSPEEHDEKVASVSHLPHVVASCLSASMPLDARELISTGWLDTTRVAGGDADLWAEIVMENRANTLKSMDNYAAVLESFRQAIENGDFDDLRELFELGKQHRDTVGN